MRTARTLEAEWRQVLRGNVRTGETEDESNIGWGWAAGFHHDTDRSRLAGVLKLMKLFKIYRTFVSLTLQTLFWAAVNRVY
jgi:hypothetical protein